jgi:hypothetical protein
MLKKKSGVIEFVFVFWGFEVFSAHLKIRQKSGFAAIATGLGRKVTHDASYNWLKFHREISSRSRDMSICVFSPCFHFRFGGVKTSIFNKSPKISRRM